MNFTTITVVAGLLTISNVFMTFAWYGHLKSLADKPWYIAVIISWLIAFFEYAVQSLLLSRSAFGKRRGNPPALQTIAAAWQG